MLVKRVLGGGGGGNILIWGDLRVLSCHSVHPPPECRVGLGDFAISSLPVGLGFFKYQGGVAIVGWGRFF